MFRKNGLCKVLLLLLLGSNGKARKVIVRLGTSQLWVHNHVCLNTEWCVPDVAPTQAPWPCTAMGLFQHGNPIRQRLFFFSSPNSVAKIGSFPSARKCQMGTCLDHSIQRRCSGTHQKAWRLGIGHTSYMTTSGVDTPPRGNVLQPLFLWLRMVLVLGVVSFGRRDQWGWPQWNATFFLWQQESNSMGRCRAGG